MTNTRPEPAPPADDGSVSDCQSCDFHETGPRSAGLAYVHHHDTGHTVRVTPARRPSTPDVSGHTLRWCSDDAPAADDSAPHP